MVGMEMDKGIGFRWLGGENKVGRMVTGFSRVRSQV